VGNVGILGLVKHLVLVDGHHLMYRAYWAIPRTLKTRSGEQSNTSFGMASMLLAILQKEEPDSLVYASGYPPKRGAGLSSNLF